MTGTGIRSADALMAVDTAIDPFFVLDAVRDEDGSVVDFRYRYVNDAGIALYQRTRSDVIGHTLLELFPVVTSLRIFEQYARVADTGVGTQLRIPTFQLAGQSASLLVNVEARDAGIAVWVRDETRLLGVEDALRRSEARFEALIDRSGDVVLLMDAQGTLAYASPALERLLGYAPAEVVGRSAFDFLHPEDLHIAVDSMVELLANPGVAAPVSYRVRHADGSWRWMEDVANNLLDDPLVEGIILTLRDITGQRTAAAELAETNRVLRAVSEADVAVMRSCSEEDLLADMCRVVATTGGYPMAWVAGRDGTGRVAPVAAWGETGGLQERVIAASAGRPVECGPATEALATGRTAYVPDLAALPTGLPIREVSLELGFRSQLALPVMVDGEVVYALSIHAGVADAFDPGEVALFEQLASNLAFGIRSMRARHRAEHTLDGVVATLARVVEQRDPYTAGHQQRVAELAGAIARELGLADHDVAGIEMASRIHDIGKIAIPGELLTKPSALTPLEFELIKQHAEAGSEMVQDIDFPWPVARMILEHHERMDGSGYPRGLVGEEIHLGSRVVAVADMVEAMVTHRPYRPGKGIDFALGQIASERGTCLDPEVVDACLRLFAEGRVTLDG
jgi:PAS domain S-box-containing protein/putative nucleotidyltransferase with HDIG domain